MAKNEEPILEEAMDSLREATQRIRAVENRMLAAGMPERPRATATCYVGVSDALRCRRRGVGGVCKKGAKRAGARPG